MYPQELLGKFALRKSPVKIVMESNVMSNIPDMLANGIDRVVYDYMFTLIPIFILASTESHIVYLDTNKMSDIIDKSDMAENDFSESEDIVVEGVLPASIVPKILNSCYIDDEWVDYNDLMELAKNYDLLGTLFGELKSQH